MASSGLPTILSRMVVHPRRHWHAGDLRGVVAGGRIAGAGGEGRGTRDDDLGRGDRVRIEWPRGRARAAEPGRGGGMDRRRGLHHRVRRRPRRERQGTPAPSGRVHVRRVDRARDRQSGAARRAALSLAGPCAAAGHGVRAGLLPARGRGAASSGRGVRRGAGRLAGRDRVRRRPVGVDGSLGERTVVRRPARSGSVPHAEHDRVLVGAAASGRSVGALPDHGRPGPRDVWAGSAWRPSCWSWRR